ncbi:deoxyribodipyrimidine photo-lyase [Pontibacterium sp.]|uniref:cryptochrome/photolyase family protein n=1 Tax=Pontibacterium sp. TaxID=2036026 RepID=UPI0035180697
MKLVWFRNDLRVRDNHALFNACRDSSNQGVVAVAVLTPKQWLLQDEANSRVQFWLANLRALSKDLAALNIPLKVLRAATNREVPEQLLALATQIHADSIYFNNEYPEYEQKRDGRVSDLFIAHGLNVERYHSDVIIEPGTVRNKQKLPFRVYTPFSKAWRTCFLQQNPEPLPLPDKQGPTAIQGDPIPGGIVYDAPVTSVWQRNMFPAGSDEAHQRLEYFAAEKSREYKQLRDYPALDSTSVLSPYLTVGAISARQCLAGLRTYSNDPDWLANHWTSEVIWREFYRHLLFDFPEMNRLLPFKPEVEERLTWSQDNGLFEAWCQGETGFPMVDAGMKQLQATGWMHNRLRMVTASFVAKLLRHDWRRGAQFFMQNLIDGDFASNLGGWQWSASVGADAAPYFRIFNPMRQAERFDPEGEYIARWIPELASLQGVQRFDPLFGAEVGRPMPIIDYAHAREQSIGDYNLAGAQT